MMKEIFSVASRKGKIFVVVATISFTIGGLLSTYLLYMIIEMVTNLGQYSEKGLWEICGLLVGIVVVKMLITFAADLAKHYAGYDVEVNIREGIIKKLKQFSLGFYSKERLGEVTTIIHKDVQNMEAAVGHFTSIMVSDILIALILGIYLFYKSWIIGVAMISILPVALILLVTGYKKAAIMQKSTNDCLANMVSYFVEYTRGIPLLRAFSESRYLEDKMEASIKKFGASARLQAKVSAKYIGRFSLFYELSYAVMIITGGILTINGRVNIDTLLLFVTLSKEFYKPFKKAESYWLDYIMVKDSYVRISKLLDSQIIKKQELYSIPKEFSVRFDNVGFCYEKDEFELKNINIFMPQGSLTALVGSSGSGKTTMANLLLRFWEVSRGSICIGNIDIRNMDYDLLLKNISIVMQNVILFSGSIRDNIMVGNRNATNKEIINAAKKAQIHDFISALPDGYETIIGENGIGLSGGQKQRISIARAFLKDAPIVLLDEITSNVDSVNGRKIQLAVNELVSNKTVITIAHQLSTIKNADQIAVFEQGKICEQGTHADLLKSHGVYGKLWKLQEGSKAWKII